MALRLLQTIGVRAKLLLNSVGCVNCRPRYVEALRAALNRSLPNLCEDCRRRSVTNSLRVLDCKVPGCQPFIERLPLITESLCSDCAEHFAGVKAYLDESGISYEVVPRLVRGLDYYVRTAFEIVSGELGAQNALAGGGRYDGLSEILGGPRVPALGFAMGLDRLVMLLSEEQSGRYRWKPELFLAHMGEPSFKKALAIARELRNQGHSCYLDYSAGTLKSQMRLANKLGAAHVLILGDNELARGICSIKRLEDSQQWEISISEISNYLKSRA